MGVAPREHVMLDMVTGARDGCGAAKIEFVRLGMDGSASEQPFRIPEGRVLVVTEADWFYGGGVVDSLVMMRIFAENLQDASKRRKLAELVARVSAGGAGANAQFTSGFLVSSKARLCVDSAPVAFTSPVRTANVLLRGYLIDER
jgi:hypothetical protein